MSGRDLVLEIGTEEIPARFLPPARAALARRATDAFGVWQLDHGEVRVVGTPRRIALLVRGLSAEQAASMETVTGPPWDRAFDDAGAPTTAGQGFAKKNGLKPGELQQIETPRGLVAGFTRHRPGRPTAELLTEAVPEWIGALPFGKNMRWEAQGLRFARPIRWLVARFGDAVLDVAVGDVQSGATSRGHRFLGTDFAVDGIDGYEREARAQSLMLDPAEREATIRRGGDELATAAGLRVDWDRAVLAEVVDLIEWPGPMLGHFDAAFLELPDVVLEAPMKAHQRYFPLRDADGKLAPQFLFVANRPDDPEGLIARGNARVLSARLSDANFFWDSDVAAPLDEHAKSLSTITWQEGLGTLDDLRHRVTQLAQDQPLREALGADATVLDRAGALYLADLGTQMVYEFAEVQGTIGAIYAARAGEPEAVTAAMAEAHLPRTADDDLPQTPAGRALSLAHRIDLIVGNLLVGHEVKGNQDPFGMRRAALGCFRIQEDAGWDGDVEAIALNHVERYRAAGVSVPADVAERVHEFWDARLTAYLSADEAVTGAEAEAVVAAAGANALSARRRLDAVLAHLSEPARRDAFLDTYKRLRNIARDAAALPIAELGDWDDKDSLFFAAAVTEATIRVQETLAAGQEAAALAHLVALEDAAAKLFDEVRIMADDPAVTERRQRLVATARAAFNQVADFNRILGG